VIGLKLTSKKAAAILAILFVCLLIGGTIYSRTFYQMQKPLVTIATSSSHSFYMSMEALGVVQFADELVSSYGYPLMTELFVSNEEWEATGWEQRFFIHVGNQVTVSLLGLWNSPVFEGTAIRVLYDEDGINITVGFTDSCADSLEGDSVHVLMERETVPYPVIVPASSVHYDSITGEYYMFFVTRQQGVWGTDEFTVFRENVEFMPIKRIGNEMLIDRWTPFENPFVVSADTPLHEGAKVRLFG